MPNREKKRLIPRWLIAIPLIVLAGYVGLQVLAVLDNRYETETAIQYTMADSVYCDGVVWFTEQPVDGAGDLGYLVANGERVSGGTAVAELYTDAEQAQHRAQLNALTARIALLERSQSAGSDIAVLLNQEQTAENDLLEALDRRQYSELTERQENYLLAANRLQVTTGQVSDFDAQLEELNAQAEQLRTALGTPETIQAPTGGYFVQAEDARTLTVDSEFLQQATPSQLQDALTDGADRPLEGAVGKVVTSYEWSFYGVCSLQDGKRIEVGSKVNICFPEKAEQTLPARVEEVVIDEAGGLAKVVLRCEYMTPQVLVLGQQRARIDLATYSGLRVDVDARHIVDGVSGVYVRFGQLVSFKPITVLYEDENYILTPESGDENCALELYDEVVVRGRALRDGKLIG